MPTPRITHPKTSYQKSLSFFFLDCCKPPRISLDKGKVGDQAKNSKKYRRTAIIPKEHIPTQNRLRMQLVKPEMPFAYESPYVVLVPEII
uniref:Uncharacterized protein n=1 Tax=Oryza brachyantha TaxID=4533 RepID=J3L794_ORYBR